MRLSEVSAAPLGRRCRRSPTVADVRRVLAGHHRPPDPGPAGRGDAAPADRVMPLSAVPRRRPAVGGRPPSVCRGSSPRPAQVDWPQGHFPPPSPAAHGAENPPNPHPASLCGAGAHAAVYAAWRRTRRLPGRDPLGDASFGSGAQRPPARWAQKPLDRTRSESRVGIYLRDSSLVQEDGVKCSTSSVTRRSHCSSVIAFPSSAPQLVSA